MIKIKHRLSGETLFTSNTAIDLASAVKEAVEANAYLEGAYLEGANLIYSFGPAGKEKRIGYAVAHGDSAMVKLGCFWGAEADALAAIEAKYGAGSDYAAQVDLACKIVKGV